MEQHIDVLEKQMEDFVKDRDDDNILKSNKTKLSLYLSTDLTKYLNTLGDYMESEEKGIGKQLKDLQNMSEEDLLMMMDTLNDQGNKPGSLSTVSSSKKKK